MIAASVRLGIDHCLGSFQFIFTYIYFLHHGLTSLPDQDAVGVCNSLSCTKNCNQIVVPIFDRFNRSNITSFASGRACEVHLFEAKVSLFFSVCIEHCSSPVFPIRNRCLNLVCSQCINDHQQQGILPVSYPLIRLPQHRPRTSNTPENWEPSPGIAPEPASIRKDTESLPTISNLQFP